MGSMSRAQRAGIATGAATGHTESGKREQQHVTQSTELDLKGLSAGIGVRFRVRAQSHAAWGEWSEWRDLRVSSRPPDPVKSMKATALRDGGVTLEWSAPKEHGSPVTAYFIQMRCLDLHREGTDDEAGAQLPRVATRVEEACLSAGANPTLLLRDDDYLDSIARECGIDPSARSRLREIALERALDSATGASPAHPPMGLLKDWIQR